MANVSSVLMGAVAMASFVAMLFFLRFWRRTGDSLFLLFALAFGVDAILRFALGFGSVSVESEPTFYIGRIITFGLIVVAIVNKNRSSGHSS
jgi:Family of unknown function (DUF5985)